jgi:hypothetical protein
MTLTRRQTLIGAAATVAASIRSVFAKDNPRQETYWEPWFAILPVEVDAYEDDWSDVRTDSSGNHFRYTVCCRWIARRWTIVKDDDEGTEWSGWIYRIALPKGDKRYQGDKRYH